VLARQELYVLSQASCLDLPIKERRGKIIEGKGGREMK
jgi:hypothetical protein